MKNRRPAPMTYRTNLWKGMNLAAWNYWRGEGSTRLDLSDRVGELSRQVEFATCSTATLREANFLRIFSKALCFFTRRIHWALFFTDLAFFACSSAHCLSLWCSSALLVWSAAIFSSLRHCKWSSALSLYFSPDSAFSGPTTLAHLRNCSDAFNMRAAFSKARALGVGGILGGGVRTCNAVEEDNEDSKKDGECNKSHDDREICTAM